jgi:hypothetical protein
MRASMNTSMDQCRVACRERPLWRSGKFAGARNATRNATEGVPYKALLVVAIAAVGLLLAAPGPAEACPSCKAALASQEGGGNLVQGFFWSIVFMMSMPFLLLGSFSGYLYFLVRRARTSQTDSPSGSPVPAATSQPAANRDEADEPIEV